MEEKFQCRKCGDCCRFFGETDNWLPLFEWEKDKMKELAEQKKISFEAKPIELIFDKKSNLAFFINYGLKGPCPFLINNKCSIYEDRPLICKAFPMGKNPYFVEEIMNINLPNCKSFTKNEWSLTFKEILGDESIPITRQDMAKKYKKLFGEECFFNSFIIGQIKIRISNIKEELIQSKKIKARKINKFDYEKYNAVPFFEFLRLKGLLNQEQKFNLINSLTDYNQIKNIIFSQGF
ncbi:MAG TPA: YkgJ family cysteine cluster protein [Candidatus Pacearchaeota archaeon]|nr:YkgJ family cysteine cluster protein [Candidatus Pacearchaeota archaeon]